MAFIDWFLKRSKLFKEVCDTIKTEQESQDKRITALEVFPVQFLELREQFTEFMLNSVNSPSTSLQVHSEVSEVKSSLNLTPHTKTAFSLIVGLLNEYSEEWLPLANLTTELYPNKEASEIRNAVSNTIKPLIDNSLIEKKREGNFVFIRLTKKGFESAQKEVSKLKLKNLARYHHG